MKQTLSFRVALAKAFAVVLRLLLSLRYKVETKGTEALSSKGPLFLLPSHQALIDPLILLSQLYKHTTAIPVVTSDFYDLPVLKPFFSGWGAVRVSNLEGKSRNTNVLNEISSAVIEGFGKGKNIVLYPSGQIAGQGYEKIINKKSAHQVVQQLPPDVRVVAVRITGLWGSMWSKAWMGKTPNFALHLLRGIFYVLANLVFFVPRRKVSIQIEDVTEQAVGRASEGRQPFNDFLERFYNRGGEEPVNYLKHYFYGRKPRRQLPERIVGAANGFTQTQPDLLDDEVPDVTLATVKTIVASVLAVDEQIVTPRSNLIVDLGADSLSMVELISEIENRFETFQAPQILDVKTVADLCFVALGKFSSDTALKPSHLDVPLTEITPIGVGDQTDIVSQFVDVFTKNGHDYFVYDAMLGSTNRKTFFLKACVVAQLIKQKTTDRRVGIMLPALQSTTLLIAATYLAGKVPVMLNWTVGKKVLEHCVDTAGINIIFTAGTFVDKIDELLPQSIKSKLVFLEKEVPRIGLFTKLKGVAVSKFPKWFVVPPRIDQTAVILFTSGSEAMPKAVPLTHRNILSDLHGVFQMIKLDNNQVFLGFLPPFHSFGFTVLSVFPLVTGIRVAYTPNPTDAREVLKVLKHTKANVLLGTPGFLKMMLNAGSDYYFKSVNLVVSGAEAMTEELKTLFEKRTRNALLIEGYGITECAPVLTLNPLDKQKLNSVGRFLPIVEHLVLDLDTDMPCRAGLPGMVYVRGNNVFAGYMDADVESPFRTIGGKQWYRTGDIGYLDEEGYLFITGRLKRFVKIAGEMISLPFLEKILLRKYAEEGQMLAVEGSDQISPPLIVLFATKHIDLNEANEYLMKEGVAAISKIRKVVVLESIPVLGTGKTDYKALKAMVTEAV